MSASSPVSTGDREALQEAAQGASEAAYCPYSGLRVGAAALGESGRVYAGCNVENASYGLTVCAERNAVFQAVAAGERRVRALAVYTPTVKPTPPCGACRQVIAEFAPPECEILCFSDGEELLRFTLAELLPHAFGGEHLG